MAAAASRTLPTVMTGHRREPGSMAAEACSKPLGRLITYIPLARTSLKAEPGGRDRKLYSVPKQDLIKIQIRIAPSTTEGAAHLKPPFGS